MRSSALARRYAKALAVSGFKQDSYEEIGKELFGFVKLLQDHRPKGSLCLSEALSNPGFPIEHRLAVLDSVLDTIECSEVLRSFLRVVVESRRAEWLEAIAVEYEKIVDRHLDRIRADVAVGREKDLERIGELKAVIEGRTGKKAIISSRVDERLIAGMVTRIGSQVWDGSLRGRLDQLPDLLLRD